jgi:DNA-binding MarR family transcriptional regulator
MFFSEKNLHAVELRVLIGALHRASIRNLEELIARHNLPVTQLQFGLLVSIRHQQQTISELSRVFALDPSTLVPAVDALVRKGYLERNADPKDRRRAPLCLTETGIAVLNDVLNKMNHQPNDVLVDGLSALGTGRTEQLLQLLRQIVSFLPEGDMILKGMMERIDAIQRIGAEHAKDCLTITDDDSRMTS